MDEFDKYAPDSSLYINTNKKSILKTLWNNIILLLYDIDCKLYYHSPIYFDCNILGMFREWWQARKVYKFPKIKFCATSYPYYINDKKHRLFSIITYCLGWKWKYDYICYERNPVMQINFGSFVYIGFWLESPVKGKDHEYWESMLNYLYMYKKDLNKTYKNWGWTDMQGNTTWDWNYIKKEKWIG